VDHDPRLRDLLLSQDGAVARRQLLSLGYDDSDLRRMVRRRELVRRHPGVYVDHTGVSTWDCRAWAAVLFYGRAALCGPSAVDRGGAPLHVAIEHPRNAVALPGVHLHRLVGLEGRTLWHVSPPRLRLEEAALDAAAGARCLSDAVAVLSRVCQERRTTPDRLLEALEGRRRTRWGRELRAVLADVRSGAQSALEVGFLRRVVGAHGLPAGTRQVPAETRSGRVYRDVLLTPWDVVVELDGLAWHGAAHVRWQDMSRDLDAAADGLVTVRVGWRHVHDEACRTADRLAALLRRRGWSGSPRRCGRGCTLPG